MELYRNSYSEIERLIHNTVKLILLVLTRFAHLMKCVFYVQFIIFYFMHFCKVHRAFKEMAAT